MSAMSDYLEVALNNLVLGGTAWSKPGTVYIALYTGAPSDSGGGNEVTTSSTGYSRLAVTNNATNWAAADGTSGEKVNGQSFIFPTATGNWGTVTHFAIFDSVSGSSYMLYWGALSTPRVINAGDTARFQAGDITVTLESGSNYLDKALNDLVLGNGSFSPPATVYLGLHTGDPGEDGLSDEVSGNGYARASVANNTSNWSTTSGTTGQKQNSNAIVFPTASGSWGSVSHWSIWSAGTAGNLLYQAALGDIRTIESGDTPRFLAGNLKIIFS